MSTQGRMIKGEAREVERSQVTQRQVMTGSGAWTVPRRQEGATNPLIREGVCFRKSPLTSKKPMRTPPAGGDLGEYYKEWGVCKRETKAWQMLKRQGTSPR